VNTNTNKRRYGAGQQKPSRDWKRFKDRDEWIAFLSMLKKYRSRQPINGVMVAMSSDEARTWSYVSVPTGDSPPGAALGGMGCSP